MTDMGELLVRASSAQKESFLSETKANTRQAGAVLAAKKRNISSVDISVCTCKSNLFTYIFYDDAHICNNKQSRRRRDGRRVAAAYAYE